MVLPLVGKMTLLFGTFLHCLRLDIYFSWNESKSFETSKILQISGNSLFLLPKFNLRDTIKKHEIDIEQVVFSFPIADLPRLRVLPKDSPFWLKFHSFAVRHQFYHNKLVSQTVFFLSTIWKILSCFWKQK